MRVARFVLSFVLILSSSPRLNSQQSSTAPQRDPQAVTRITQMLAATGWLPAARPTTIMALGTITRDQLSQSFTLKQRGPFQHRFALQQRGATSTVVINGLVGAVLFFDNTKMRMPAHAAISTQSPVFPFLSDLANIADPSVEVRDLGVDTIDGIACYGTYVARRASSSDPLARFRDLAAPLKVWTSAQSSLPVRIDFIRLADDNPYVVMNFSRSFSDYRVVNGIAVAFQQEERFGNQLMYRFTLTDVQFGVALSDADFDSSRL
jgi:hypothetical protein